MAQKLSFACVEMILRYHLSPQQILFTYNWACHDTAVCVFGFGFCVLCGLLLFVCVFVLCLVLLFFVFGFSASSGT